ncbi:MAG: phosphatase PAP2 family protein [Aestuariivirga sp.]
MDQAITLWINSFAGRNNILDGFMIAASQFGIPLIVAFVVLQWWSKAERVHVRHTCVASALSFLLGLGLNQIILLFVHRLRPYDAGISHLIISRSTDWSFPSDHATASVAIAATLFLHGLRRRAMICLTLAILICWSRIFVGTHYVTDVLGGGLVGIVAAVLVWKFYREGSRLDRFVTSIL